MKRIFKYLRHASAFNYVFSIFNNDAHGIVSEKGREVIRSGEFCKCNSCGHIGYAYGIAHAKGVSHPFCQNCGVNSKLEVVKK